MTRVRKIGFTTALSCVICNNSLQVLAALEMTMLTDLVPRSAAPMAWYFLRDEIDAIQTLGIVTVVAGIVLVELGVWVPAVRDSSCTMTGFAQRRREQPQVGLACLKSGRFSRLQRAGRTSIALSGTPGG